MADPVKISDSSIEMDKVTPEVRTTVKYERSFIEQQRKDIIKQSDDFVAARMKEVAECDAILSEMDRLGVVSKPVAEQIGDI